MIPLPSGLYVINSILLTVGVYESGWDYTKSARLCLAKKCIYLSKHSQAVNIPAQSMLKPRHKKATRRWLKNENPLLINNICAFRWCEIKGTGRNFAIHLHIVEFHIGGLSE